MAMPNSTMVLMYNSTMVLFEQYEFNRLHRKVFIYADIMSKTLVYKILEFLCKETCMSVIQNIRVTLNTMLIVPQLSKLVCLKCIGNMLNSENAIYSQRMLYLVMVVTNFEHKMFLGKSFETKTNCTIPISFS